MSAPTSAPVHPKVAAQALAGTVVTTLVTLLSAIGVIVPDNVSTAAVVLVGAAVTIFNFVVGYSKSA
jgi:hypothetical protein